ncbi:MAG: hypothetical protein FWG68_05580 [Defluviitaleaceae bacterium]|nr:hypothetical protein [Defluviitaleaceae bacterium]
MLKSFWIQPENNFILFVDILGVKEHIKNGRTSVLTTILDTTVKEMKRVAKIMSLPDVGKDSVYFKMFSDNIIICSKSNWNYLLLVAAGLQKHLATFGIFLRGSLCFGSICAQPDFVLGEGLVRAYELESKCSVYPRIIVDTSFIEAMQEHISATHADNHNKIFVSTKEKYFEVDKDEKIFIDYLNEARLAYNSENITMLNLMVEHQFRVKANLLLHENKHRLTYNLETGEHIENIYKKFVWCRDYHNAFCQKHNQFLGLLIDEDIEKWRCEMIEQLHLIHK